MALATARDTELDTTQVLSDTAQCTAQKPVYMVPLATAPLALALDPVRLVPE